MRFTTTCRWALKTLSVVVANFVDHDASSDFRVERR